jgi:hypothetical protein
MSELLCRTAKGEHSPYEKYGSFPPFGTPLISSHFELKEGEEVK